MRTLLASTLALLTTTSACGTDPTDMPEMPEVQGATQGVVGLAPVAMVRVIRNASIEVPVSITRDENAMGTITVSMADLPAGVTAEPIELGHGATTGILKITAGADIALGTIVTATLRATANDGAEASAPVDLRLTDRQGALDVSFNGVGIRATSFTGGEEWATDIVRQPDGKWLIAGVSSTNVYYVARLHADGSPERSFGTAGVYKPPVYSGSTSPRVVLRADGTILLGTRISGFTAIRALDAQGQPLQGYGNRTAATELSALTLGSNFSFVDMAAGPDGSLYVAGIESGLLKVVRLNAAGLPDSTFDTDGLATADLGGAEISMAIAVRPDGRPIVAGRTDSGGDKIALAQFTLQGALDPSFSGDGKLIVNASGQGLMDVIVLSNNKLALAVASTYSSVVIVNEDGIGTQTSTLTDASKTIYGLTEHDGAIYGAGFASIDVAGLMRFSLDGQLDTAFATNGTAGVDAMTGGVEGGYTVSFDDDGRAIMVGLGRPDGGTNSSTLSRLWL
jgi:uncharacterized delta-60 repeat protein